MFSLERIVMFPLFIIIIATFSFGEGEIHCNEDEEGNFECPQDQQLSQIETDVQEIYNKDGETSVTVPEYITISTPNGPFDIKGKIKVKKKKVTAEYVQTSNGELQNAEDFEKTPDGYKAAHADEVIQDGTVLSGASGVIFSDNVLSAQHADSFTKDSSVTTNINNLNSNPQFFSVDRADTFISSCIRIDGIEFSEFFVDDKVEVFVKANATILITDCAFNQSAYTGKGRIGIDKTDNPAYEMKLGTLRAINTFNESFKSFNSASIETDKTFGFRCISMKPEGSYNYLDQDLRKAFAIDILNFSAAYNICVKKNNVQKFDSYDGLIDYSGKKIELDGVANYFRHQLKNGIVLDFPIRLVYSGLNKIKTVLDYDANMIFLNQISISNEDKIKGKIAVTYPSSYYKIVETNLSNDMHSIIILNLNLTTDNFTDNINYEYKTSYFEPIAKIKNNVMAQEKAKHRLTILPPGHNEIGEFLKNEN